MEDVPIGKNEIDNVEISKNGEIPNFNFKPKSHYELGKNLKMLDFDLATKTSGSRFVFVNCVLAQLERAISNFMLDTHTNINGYKEISPPLIVSDDTMYGTGQLPKFENDQFEIKFDVDSGRKFLIPTAEVILTNIVKNKIVNLKELPLRFVASTPCFRKEAGSYGKDTKGMIRQHQFYKVELVSIVEIDQCKSELERMTNCATMILDKLNLPYRKIILCTGDMGFSAEKTYDIEVWLPSENKYREISSCSSCGQFQARRMKSKYKNNNNETTFVGTLNGSGLAIGRTLIAILENYQNSDGSVNIPKVLKPYMNNLDKIQKIKSCFSIIDSINNLKIKRRHMSGSGIGQFIPLILIFVIFYFFLIRPQQKKAKDHKLMVSNLKRGDKVVTSGGIVGTIERIVDNDKIEILISENVVVEIFRDTGIQALLNAPEPKK